MKSIIYFGSNDTYGELLNLALQREGQVISYNAEMLFHNVGNEKIPFIQEKSECWIYYSGMPDYARYHIAKKNKGNFREKNIINEIPTAVLDKMIIITSLYSQENEVGIDIARKRCKETGTRLFIFRIPTDDIFLFGSKDKCLVESIKDKLCSFIKLIKERVPNYFCDRVFHVLSDDRTYGVHTDKTCLIENIVNQISEANDVFFWEKRICQSYVRLQDIVSMVMKENEINIEWTNDNSQFDNLECQFMRYVNFFFPIYEKEVYGKQEKVEISWDGREKHSNKCDIDIVSMGTRKEVQDKYGKTLTYYVYGNSVENRMIIFNAYGVKLEAWKYFINELAGKYRIYIWTTRGISGEDTVASKLWGVKEQIEDAELIVEKEKIDKLHVVSWCSGAKNAIMFANRNISKVESIISIAGEYAPYIGSESDLSKFRKNIVMIAQLISENSKLLDFYVKIVHDGLFNKSIVKYDNETYENIFEIMPLAHRDVLLSPFQTKDTMLNFLNMCIEYYSYDITKELEKIECPVLFIVGENDKVAPYMQTVWATTHVKNSQCVCLAGATHLLILENIEEVVNMINGNIPGVDSTSKIKKEITEYLLSEIIFSHNEVDSSTNLIESGLVDSISIVKIILHIEKAFSIAFSEEDMHPENFESIDNMERTILRKKENLNL